MKSIAWTTKKRRRKPFPDETEPEYRIKHDGDIDDGEHQTDEAEPDARSISAPGLFILMPTQEAQADDGGVLIIGYDVLQPLQAHDAPSQDAS